MIQDTGLGGNVCSTFMKAVYYHGDVRKKQQN